jgi:hypothetical protein
LESEGIALPFLTSALLGGQWSAARTGRLTPGKGLPLSTGGQETGRAAEPPQRSTGQYYVTDRSWLIYVLL